MRIRVGDLLAVQSARDGRAAEYPHGIRVLSVHGPCPCPSYPDRLGAMDGGQVNPAPPGPLHWHFSAVNAEIPPGQERRWQCTYHTVTQRADGRWWYAWPVWDERRRREYAAIGAQAGTQLGLFTR